MKTRTAAMACVGLLGSSGMAYSASCPECYAESPLWPSGGIVLRSVPPGITLNGYCCGSISEASFSSGVFCRWSIELENLQADCDNSETTAFSSAAAAAWNLESRNGLICCACDLGPPADADLDADIEVDTIFCGAIADAEAHASAGCEYSGATGAGSCRGYVNASANWGVSSVSQGGIHQAGNIFSVGCYPSDGSASYLGGGIAAAEAIALCDYSYEPLDPQAPTSIKVCICLSAEAQVATFSQSTSAVFEECGTMQSPDTPVTFSAFQVKTSATFHNGATNGTSASTGVLGFMEDGSVVALGSLAGTSLPDGDPTANLDRAGVVDLTITSPVANPVRLEFDIEQDAISEFDGDLDEDQDVDCHDRDIFLSLVGKNITTDADYNFRADFDLDGTIEADDYREFIPLMLESADFTLADFNCDGVCNEQDLNDYQTAAALGSLSTELVPDGYIDIYDYMLFVNAYLEGC